MTKAERERYRMSRHNHLIVMPTFHVAVLLEVVEDAMPMATSHKRNALRQMRDVLKIELEAAK